PFALRPTFLDGCSFLHNWLPSTTGRLPQLVALRAHSVLPIGQFSTGFLAIGGSSAPSRRTDSCPAAKTPQFLPGSEDAPVLPGSEDTPVLPFPPLTTSPPHLFVLAPSISPRHVSGSSHLRV